MSLQYERRLVHISNPTAKVDTDTNGNPVAGSLNGTYQYYVTFFNDQSNVESRPQLVATTSPALTNEQVTLSNLPAPNSGTWTSERIYRSTNDQPGDTNCYQIADIPIGDRDRQWLHLHRRRHPMKRSAATGQALEF